MRASHALTAAPDYNKRKLVQAMEDAGPVFVYAHNFLQRAVEDAKKKNSAADADAATSDADIGGGSSSAVSSGTAFSVHSNVGIKLLQYGADDLGLAHFVKAAALDPAHAGMRVRVSMAYPAVKASVAHLEERRAALEANVRGLETLPLQMQEPTFEIG